MQNWILSVAGIAILSVLADVILPVGQTKKYIKTVIGVAITLATVEPLLSVFGEFGSTLQQTENTAVATQQSYLDYVAQTKTEQIDSVKTALISAGFADAEVSYDVENCKFIAKLRAEYSPEANKIARAAVDSVCAYPVTFRWNDG